MHWLTLVLVPKDSLDVRGKVAELLSPDPERSFPEYPVACWCVGSEAHEHGYTVVDTIGGGASEIQKNIIARRGLGLPPTF